MKKGSIFSISYIRIVLFFIPVLSLCSSHAPNNDIPEGVLSQSGLSTTFVAKFALFIAIVLLWTIAWGKLLKLVLNLPVIAGQIVGGILLGPSLIDIQHIQFFSDPIFLIKKIVGNGSIPNCLKSCPVPAFAIASSDLFVFVLLLISSAFTVSYLLWIAGHETDIKDIIKVGVTAVSAGIFGAIIPIVMTVGVIYYFLGGDYTLARSIGIGLILAATSVSIPVAMLFAHNKMHLKSSKATLGAAIIDDIFAVILLSVFLICLQSGALGETKGFVQPLHTGTISEAVSYLLVSFAVIFGTGYFIIPVLIAALRRRHYSHLIASVANGIMLLYFAFAELIGGLAGITGAYFAGLFHRMGDVGHKAERTISPFVSAFLLPLFLGSIGLQLNVTVLSVRDWFVVVLLLIVAILSKMTGCFAATALSNFSGRRGRNRWSMLETYLFGSSMVARGEVGLVISTILYGANLLTPQQYVIAVMVIVLTTIAAPIMLAIGFARLELEPREKKNVDFIVRMGPFSVMSAGQMFGIIASWIEASGLYKTSIRFSEGRRILNIEGQNVKVILCPEEGVLFEGNQKRIEELVENIKNSIGNDLANLSVAK